jgi:outer membrane protein OmpA-like peptidoglycan-associated protein
MRSLRARLVALFIAAIGFAICTPRVGHAEVGGFHVNLTPYAGFATWAKDVNLQDGATYGGRLGLGFGKTFGIEGTYGLSSTKTQVNTGLNPWVGSAVSPETDADFTHMGGDLQINLAPSSAINPYIFGGYASHKIEVAGQAEKSYEGPNFGGGLKMHFSPRWAFRVEARDMVWDYEDAEKNQAINPAPDGMQHNLEYTGGIMWSLGGTTTVVDTDGDGIGDKKDECPNTPAGCVVDAKGCPVDTDGDGVCDGVDTCPATPSGVKVDEKGCPMDSDGDGVPDGPDQCASTPAGCTVDANGCPVDSDRDGVCDGLDQCANTPSGARVDEKGCPTDTDGDGVFDGIDMCPNTPAGARVDATGCPIEISVMEQELLDKGMITARNIYFDTGKATLKPESEQTLRELCTILQQWPTLKIEVGGHTDSQGGDAFNQKLSEERAGSVREWGRANCPGLVQDNFSSAGYGEKNPVASNGTAKGRAQNRRVEFKVLNPEELKRLKERRETLMKDSAK